MFRIGENIFLEDEDRFHLSTIPGDDEIITVDRAPALFKSILERKRGTAVELFIMGQQGASAGEQNIALEKARAENERLDTVLGELGSMAAQEIAEALAPEMFDELTSPA